MALVRKIQEVAKQRHSVHGDTSCSYSAFRQSGKTYLQLDTYGSKQRKLRGKISQTLQFNEQAAKELMRIIEETFPNLRSG
jgi:hypothetical protein